MPDFSQHLIAWQRQHGRHDLPWQNTRDPYRIWVAEIMLQQTQVATVIPYYQRFMTRFPDVSRLAAAQEDDVLAHWSGLGYYARARNLHAAARLIVAIHQGHFPHDIDAMHALPGIGRSTAAAIAAFAFGARAAILDGNVKRVLARCFGIEGFPGDKRVESEMWTLAESLLPMADIESYTQALMDLGATLCTRGKPRCAACPIQPRCVAQQTGRTAALPSTKPRKALPEREAVVLILQHGVDIMLEKRPAPGIWGGLWSFPEIERDAILEVQLAQGFALRARRVLALAPLVHSFTHFRLTLRPLWVEVTSPPGIRPGQIWLPLDDAQHAAIPTPVRKLLDQIRMVLT